MTDAASIILICIVILLQEIQIIRLQTKVNFLDRQRKSILRSMGIQNDINDALVNLIISSVKIK